MKAYFGEFSTQKCYILNLLPRTHGMVKKHPTCSDQLDPFNIKRGFPAEREIGERETIP